MKSQIKTIIYKYYLMTNFKELAAEEIAKMFEEFTYWVMDLGEYNNFGTAGECFEYWFLVIKEGKL